MSLFSRALTLVRLVPSDITASDSGIGMAEVRRGLKYSLVEGMLAQVHISLTTGALLTGFALLLGAGNLTLGIVVALPFLVQPLQIFGAWLIERQGSRKPLAVYGSIGRSLWLVLLLLPYLPLTPARRMVLMLVTLLVAHTALTVNANAWTNWMTDLVPQRLRGRYFGTRNTAMAAVAMAANFGAGVWLDRMRDVGREADGYAVILGVAVVCGAVATLLLTRQPEPPLKRVARLPLADVIRRPLREPRFRRFMWAMIVWHVALGIAVPFFSAQALTVLNLPFTTLAMLDVITAAISLFTLSFWGQYADRIGQRGVLVMCMFGVIAMPWFWVFATPSTIWLLYVNAVISGIWWPGITITLANRLMEQVPNEARGAYFAFFAAGTGLAYFAASTGGGVLADLLVNLNWTVGSVTITNYTLIFILSSLLRGSTLLFWRKAL